MVWIMNNVVGFHPSFSHRSMAQANLAGRIRIKENGAGAGHSSTAMTTGRNDIK